MKKICETLSNYVLWFSAETSPVLFANWAFFFLSPFWEESHCMPGLNLISPNLWEYTMHSWAWYSTYENTGLKHWLPSMPLGFLQSSRDPVDGVNKLLAIQHNFSEGRLTNQRLNRFSAQGECTRGTVNIHICSSSKRWFCSHYFPSLLHLAPALPYLDSWFTGLPWTLTCVNRAVM